MLGASQPAGSASTSPGAARPAPVLQSRAPPL